MDQNPHHYHSGQKQSRGRILVGLLFVVAGVLLFVRYAGIDLPLWLFSWQMLLIAIGVVIGLRHGLKPGAWIVPIVVGLFFMLNEFFRIPFEVGRFFWPVLIILVGFWIIFRSRGREKHFLSNQDQTHHESTDADRINATAVFGGVKRKVISKHFLGGEITSVFGGSEIDLSHADINGHVVLDTTQMCGGTKLIVPANWIVKTEVTAIFGGVDDKRHIVPGQDPGKTLLLTGVSIFGGLEIASF